MEVKLFNTMGRGIETFVPREAGKAGMYACGFTVYNYAHIGNLRTYIFQDVLRKTLEYAGINVTHVMNVTDVGHLVSDADEGEDKMIKSSRETGKTVWEIADFYTKAFFKDFGLLSCSMPHVVCKATDHIPDMIDLIKRLEAGGHTYVSGGNVYFDIRSFPDYGKLALLDRQDLMAGARIEVDSGKKNPADFVLWFTQSKFQHQDMLWDSPWGRGYPGWHIECSAMSVKYLGEQFDIHCGGIDHIPVHHTNEIAQTEAATGRRPWVRYWLHADFLLMGKEKMSKSKGNFITLGTLLEKGFEPLDYRYFCLGATYRAQLAFTAEGVEAARTARRGVIERVVQLKKEAGDAPAAVEGKAGEYLERFEEHAADDLNMPKCLADLWTLLRDASVPAGAKLGAAFEMDRILDVGIRGARESRVSLDEAARALIEEREEARRRKDWKRADEIRSELAEKGIVLQDQAKGTKVRSGSSRPKGNNVTSDGKSC